MSRIGKQPVPIPDKVKVTVTNGTVLVEGPKGKVSKAFASAVKVTVGDKKITFAPTEETRFANAMYGTARSIVAGMVKGTVWDNGQGGIESTAIADKFWNLYQARDGVRDRIS